MICTVVALTWSYAVTAQSTGDLQVAKVFATLETSIDTLTSARDDRFTLVTINDVGIGGKVVIPKGSKIVGHVAGVTSKGKDASKSVLGLLIDKAVTDSGDVPLQAIIVAVAAPKTPEPQSSASATANVSDQAKTNAPVRAVQAGDVTRLLAENDQGAIGFEDVTISWHLSIPPPLTILATRGKRLRIEAGSQMLLRMMPPKADN